MTSQMLCRLVWRLMRHPTAPYFEYAVREEVESICREYGLDFSRDRFGNVMVRLKTDGRQRPFVLAAHMDHPGFEVTGKVTDRKWLIRFCGGVPDSYFKAGISVLLMPGGVRAKLGKRKAGDRIFEAIAQRAPETPPTFAVWDLVDFEVRQQRIHGRACDDLAGVAATLAVMIELKRSRARVNVIGVISRAEEVGFHGAMALAAARGIPANSLVVSLETSRELPGVKTGQGVILRVGDRTSVFDQHAMRFLHETASGLNNRTRPFPFQRGLMSGGTCEATSYQEFGFQTGAVCVALGNYHNCARNKRIAAEYVSISDVCGMVSLLVAVARGMGEYKRLIGKLPRRLEDMLAEARPRLLKTAANQATRPPSFFLLSAGEKASGGGL